MKKSKDIYSKAFEEYRFDEAKLNLLHSTLFDMLMDIKRVCDKHGISFILAGGTMLGAVRHKGFIPWDDDLDILMLRSEYERFRECFVGETDDKYYLVEPLEKEYTNKKPKVFLKESVFTEVNSAGLPERYRRVFIDIFIIENVPDSPIVRKIVGKFYNFAFFASGLAADFKYPSPIILEKAKNNSDLRKYYRSRRILGGFFSLFFGMRFYIKITNWLGHTNKPTEWVAIPSSFGYNREVFPKDFFTDLIQVPFNGELFSIPARYDEYLSNLYHNYMELPPVEARQVHSCAEFKILNDTENN